VALLVSAVSVSAAAPGVRAAAPDAPHLELFAAVEGYKYGFVRRFDLTTGQPLATGPSPTYPRSMRLGPDGDIYMTGKDFAEDGNPPILGIRRYDRKTGAFKGDLVPPGADDISTFAFGPADSLYVGYNGSLGDRSAGYVARFDARTGAAQGALIASSPDVVLQPLAVGPDDRLYLGTKSLLGAGDSCIRRYNRQTGALIDTLTCGAYSSETPAIGFGPDGNVYALLSSLGSITRYNIASAAPLGTLGCPGDSGVSYIAFGPDGDLYARASETQIAHLQAASGACLGHIALSGLIVSDNGFQERVNSFLVLAPPPARVSAGLAASYTFDERSGDVIHDRSGVGAPLDLRITRPQYAHWSAGGLEIAGPTVVRTAGPARKLIAAARASDALTLEAWVTPAARDQFAARIVTISSGPTRRNLSLIQGRFDSSTPDLVSARLRSVGSAPDGGRALLTPAHTLAPRLTHIVYTRSADGSVRIYIDGVLQASAVQSGALDSWNPAFPLVLAGEANGLRGWRGTYHLVAFYDRALSADEVGQNFAAGPGAGR
jgi:hypothetical protein